MGSWRIRLHNLSDGAGKHFSKKVLVGLFILLPLVLSWWIIKFIFQLIDNILQPVIASVVGREIFGLGFLAALLILYSVGMFAATEPGQRYVALFHALLLRIPVVKSIYSIAQSIVESFQTDSSSKKTGFNKVVAVEYPRMGAISLGIPVALVVFKGVPHIAVYFPTAPMPQSGLIALFPEDEVEETDLPTSEFMTLIVSLGITAPDAIDTIPSPGISPA